MLLISQKVRYVIAGFMVSLFGFSPVVLADDTEIYVGLNQGVNDVPPNILFVVDTSGSMSSLVDTVEEVTAPGPYDSTQTYAGSFDVNRVYYGSGSSYFYLNNLRCQVALDRFATVGFINARFAQWRSRRGNWRWRSISSRSRDVECIDDGGVHGQTAGDSRRWAANSSGPWRTTEDTRVGWRSYTLSSGNYKNWQALSAAGGVVVRKQRIEIVKEAITNLLGSLTNNVNVGLMRFDSSTDGGMVVTPVGALDTVQTDFVHELYRMYPSGGTPLAKSLYEAAMYYKGGSVSYGSHSRERAYNLTIPQTPYTGAYNSSRYYDGISNTYYNRNSHAGSISGSSYNSPIDFQCQKNFVVFLTDGEPSTSDTISSSQRSNVGATSCNRRYDSNDSGTTPDMYHCLPRIAEAMANIDQNPSLAGDQLVSTYTIGFATDQVLLEDTARLGGGEYQTAEDSASLAAVFNNIIIDILSTSATFSSPAVSVNAFNRTSHREDLYFTVFAPKSGPHWDGNFKRYKLSFRADGTPEIVDKNDEAAVSLTTGFFRDAATSFWTSGSPDGKDADLGGAASNLSNSRRVYTNISSGDSLTDGNNAVHEYNSGYLDAAALEIDPADTAYRTKLLRWARGIDVADEDDDGDTNDARITMGDPLHGQPALVQYGGPDDDPDITGYIVTNDGYLHAIDTRENSGEEIFSFIPKELVKNLDKHYQDSLSQPKLYGLDGSVVAWVRDRNKNGIIEPGNGDKVYIYFGMRRGGRNLYALDVTNRAEPKMLWTIEGGTGDFAELGQTWSTPVLRKVKENGIDKYVLVFGGGYDTAQDGTTLRSTDALGRAVYMVDAETGSLEWHASSVAGADTSISQMQYSIPADVAAVDSNSDTYLDVLYAVDMGGQVFRFDFPEGELNDVVGGRIAELASDSIANSRRFYYSPDVAILRSDDRMPKLAVVLQSGYRAHPLSDEGVENRIYMIRDTFPVPGVAPTYATITESDLFDTTDNIIADGTDEEKEAARALLNTKSGWYVTMETSGEKGLSKPFIYDNKVFATTFLPPGAAAGAASCDPAQGSGLLYVMSLLDAQPESLDDEVEDPDRTNKLSKSGIPADPILIKIKGKADVGCVGTECFKVSGSSGLKSEYWFEQ